MDIKQIAGSRNDFQLVRHLTVTGSQFEIGRALAEEARRLGWAPVPGDPAVNRARMAWFERHWPQHHARMDGAAAVLGLDPNQDDLVLDGQYGLPVDSGCSALWCPPSASSDGHGRIGRNYDFFTLTTGEVMGGAAAPGELPMAARPHVITTLPDEGLASTVITMMDLDGCMDGINEAGLSVALLMADVATAEPPQDSTAQVGLGQLHLPRFLMDTCANAEQAKQALLGAKQYDHGLPCHYLVADASGRAFVWERGSDGREHIVDLGDAPLCVTNHLLHRHPDPMNLPEDTELTFDTFRRLRTLHERSKGVTMSPDDLRESMRAVQVDADPAKPWRTTWSSVFDTADRTLSTRFYLGDGPDGPRYTEEVVLSAAR